MLSLESRVRLVQASRVAETCDVCGQSTVSALSSVKFPVTELESPNRYFHLTLA